MTRKASPATHPNAESFPSIGGPALRADELRFLDKQVPFPQLLGSLDVRTHREG